MSTEKKESPQFQSYLNNDGIDDLTPATRKHRVSSLSLSDLNQWQNGLTKLSSSTSLSKQGSHANLKKVDSLAKLSRNSSIIKRKKKSVIDHPRVASYAFCFDIDGVILRGPNTIPQAVDAIKMLNGENKYNIKVPSIYVTNGGGKPEKVRAEDLSKRLQTEIKIEQIIQGHTPMRDLVPVYENVLVVGGVGNVCRHVAESYGFKNVFTPLDILKWNPAVSPYHDLTEEETQCCRHDVDFSKTTIDAILVFADSRNWAADQQIILELLLSKNGVMGTESKTYDEGPEIYFAHSDFIWATNYKLNRYGMGALQVSIAALYKEHTGHELKVHRFGKPQAGTFKFANKILSKWRKGMLDEHLKKLSVNDPNAGDADILIGEDGEEFINQAKLEAGNYEDEYEENDGKIIEKLGELSVQDKITLQMPPASTVYFVGDTPESDIRFANSHDDSWFSILVKTGVYQEGTVPKYKPKHLCDNVLEAVKFAIEREHAMELAEWNETATEEEGSASRVSSKINFNDFVMTPSEKKDQEEKDKIKNIKNVDEHESVEVPDLLSAQLNKFKDAGA
ncbi:HAD-superfamily subfamily IIA hydrolase [Metschnikowia bicuspidata var. bicuspidata NRRL YB-4993]|uniref:HAD-superfamily subfamily IIA hydrolase n=1 Tax=Metschnikowia bicuspidata var. bicuspidata NRRL YB-4993 TaxID=869754 RepID=A0A1A0HCH6_9ASCO|nr:HAD-superfamily subfamily IIA hydrolase [Metschnikowia bicuspidata var. bicuspidata NRRL YB-4993]OBA21695.1 HAD-superfamily subfamily IIA hydrolase [Metschnikowia bicuspidata var. bicuspidata NRRL YB-4993]